MNSSFEYITSLEYRLKAVITEVMAFKSGEKYIKMKNEYLKELRHLERVVYVNYRCHTYTAYSHDACTKHTIPEHEIESAVLQTIQQYAQMLLDFEKVLKELDYKKHRRSQAEGIDKRLVQLQRELDGIEQIKLGLYTDLKRNIITQEDYISLKSGYSQKTATLAEQIAMLKEERQNLDHKDSLQNEWMARFRQYGQIDSLTRSLVTELVARIDVHEGRTITIHFKFEDEFERVKAFAEQEMQKLQAAS